MNKINILAVCSSTKHSRKHPVKELILTHNGIEGDVHAGPWNRQVSIIDKHDIDQFKKHTDARDAEFGEFAENITTSGLKDTNVVPYDKFKIGEAELEVTQIGKDFHDKFMELGNYVMPRVGIFCRVTKPGTIKAGDTMQYIPKTFNALVVTLSDRASKGEYEDKSGPIVGNMLETFFKKKKMPYKISSEIIADNAKKLQEIVLKAKQNKFDIIITTGGTGIGMRDITVDTIQPMLDKEIPGVMEMIRMKYGAEKPNALLSRGVAGVMDQSLVYTLPGSVKAVNEYMTEITKTLFHLIYMLHGIDIH
ncbi:MAG: molybdenum cofactor synthesis domain-containing protein [Bacteroidota bacterium]|nr:molybdenum cofactor synthesis domain-containing protein [Bacteroidota bacterium]